MSNTIQRSEVYNHVVPISTPMHSHTSSVGMIQSINGASHTKSSQIPSLPTFHSIIHGDHDNVQNQNDPYIGISTGNIRGYSFVIPYFLTRLISN